MWAKHSFLVGVLFCSLVVGDEYFYNLQQWVQPVMKEISEAAVTGMLRVTHIANVLEIPKEDVAELDKGLREKMAQHLSTEMERILATMQRLITIVKDFSLDLNELYHKSVSDISNGAADPDFVGNWFLDRLIDSAKFSLNEIMEELDYGISMSQHIEDNLSGQVFQKMAVRIAREILKGVDAISVEQAALNQIDLVLEGLFADKDHVIEEGLLGDIMQDMRNLIKDHKAIIEGKEVILQDWLRNLATNALKGANPHIQLLRDHEKKVISEACRFCNKVCTNAYDFFRGHREYLDTAWERIEKIVKTIIEEDKHIE